MTKEELEKEARKDVDSLNGINLVSSTMIAIDKYGAYKLGRYDGYLAGAEPREKRIAELEEEVVRLRNEGLENINKYTRFAETDKRTIAELEAQIEKMKNCKNCANYMISGKCPRLFRTGWCKNWEMTRGRI